MHGELATLGIKVAASTVREILTSEGIDPAPDRAAITWADLLRSQAEAQLACDFIEAVTLTGQRQYILAVIEHATRRIRVLGTTAHPTAAWVSWNMEDGKLKYRIERPNYLEAPRRASRRRCCRPGSAR